MLRPTMQPAGKPIPLGLPSPGRRTTLRQALAAWVAETNSSRPARASGPAGGLVVCGPQGCGKSSFLRSAAMELARLTSPDHLRLAGIDPGGRGLAVMEALPHMHLELATSPLQAEPILAWLSEEAVWREAHRVSHPRFVLLMDARDPELRRSCLAAWRRLRYALRRGRQIGMAAVLSWEGVPFGADWSRWFGDAPQLGVALPDQGEWPARDWRVWARGACLRLTVPRYGAGDLDAAVQEIGREARVWGQAALELSRGYWDGGLV